MALKPNLTPEEKITAAYARFVRQIEQQTIALVLGVNLGRINEACKTIGAAVGLTPPGYKDNG